MLSLSLVTVALSLLGGLACAGAGVWILRHGERSRRERLPALVVMVLGALWCVLNGALASGFLAQGLLLTALHLGLIVFLFRLFANDGRDASVQPVRPVIAALALVELLQPLLALIEWRSAGALSLLQMASLFRLLVATGALVLLHNLYAGAAGTSRPLLRWSTAALGLYWVYEFNFGLLTLLSGQIPWLLAGLRPLVLAALAVLLALGQSPRAAGLEFQPSRSVAFQSLSLLLIAAYGAFMLMVTRLLSFLGGDLARVMQLGFLIAATLAAIVWLPSARLRGWFRVTIAKHLFRHRYDYRAEWLRFMRTIGRKGMGEADLHERIVKALADITASDSGLLLIPDEQAQLVLAARWNWQGEDVPTQAASAGLASLLEREQFIVDLDELRRGREHHGERALLPPWLVDSEQAWLLVPLLHFERLVGLAVLSRPPFARALDWEDLDLLRVVSQQLGSYLAEQMGQEALMEARRFDDFNRRIAFVMHDIKNLASQLSLLAQNAEKHAENPDFRADMLVTLRNSSDKLQSLLARLGRYGSPRVEAIRPLRLDRLAQRLVERFAHVHPVYLVRCEPCPVTGDEEALEQALGHLLQNAIEASHPQIPVHVAVWCEGASGSISIVDSGEGMDPGFVRNGLFKPFVSSKSGGFGIGAYEARELVRAMGGRLSVDSRQGVGTRFDIVLPVALEAGEASATGAIASGAMDPGGDARLAPHGEAA